MKLTGIYVALGTPLDVSENVDERGLRRLTRFVLEAGVHGVLVNGSMGSFPCLTDAEQFRAAEIVCSEVAGVVPVVGGVGDTGTKRALQKSRDFIRAGVDYLAVLPPFFYLPTQDQVISFFSSIADGVERPVLIYDNPVHTKCYINPETVEQLHKYSSNIIGIKESNQDCANLQRLLTLMEPYSDFSVFTGSEDLMLAGLKLGCAGSIGGLHNLCPSVVVGCYNAFTQGDWDEAMRLQESMREVAKVFEHGAVWGGFDEALRILGICDCASGAPYSSRVTAQGAERVRAILAPYLYSAALAGTASGLDQLEKASG